MRRLRNILLLFFMWTITASVPLSAATAETVIPLATGEWVPYASQHLPSNGAAAEIVTAAFQAVGMQVRFEFYPWKRAETAVANGTVFAAFPYFVLAERVARSDLFLHSQPLFSSVYGILYNTTHTDAAHLVDYHQPRDLAGKRIGILAGTPMVAHPLQDAGVSFEETPVIEFSVRKLYAGRIDYVIDDRAVLSSKIQELFPGETSSFAFLPIDFTQKRTMHLLVSKNYPQSEPLLQRYNEGLRIISTNGTLDALYKKHKLSM